MPLDERQVAEGVERSSHHVDGMFITHKVPSLGLIKISTRGLSISSSGLISVASFIVSGVINSRLCEARPLLFQLPQSLFRIPFTRHAS